MTSVADIPDDSDDDLPGISPELVLVDPELARLVRERERALVPFARPAPNRDSALRLVPAADDPIVPRPAPGVDREPARFIREKPVLPAPDGPATPEDPGPEEVAAAPILDAEPTEAIGSTRVVEAEPARALAAARPEIPTPLGEPPQVAATSAAAEESIVTLPARIPATVMPHPVTRPAVLSAPRPQQATSARGSGRGRRFAAPAVAVLIASVAVLGILQLTGGSSDFGSEATVGVPPGSAKAANAGTPPPAKAKAKAKAKASAAASKPAKQVSKQKTAPKPTAAAKTRAVTQKPDQAKPTSKSAPKPTPKPKAAVPQAPKAQSPTKAAPAVPDKATSAPATRRFAWAPVEGATGYHVELFRGADRVLETDTKEPVLELAPSWRYGGKAVQLTPGAYRWYVWPVTSSGRAAQAVVQAKLTVS